MGVCQMRNQSEVAFYHHAHNDKTILHVKRSHVNFVAVLKTLARFRRHKKNNSGTNEMSFLEHLEELRMTIWSCLVAFAVAAGTSIVFYKEIFSALRWPLEHALANRAGEVASEQIHALTAMRFMDVFSILLYIAFFGGIAISCPIILYKLGRFIAPALTAREQRKIVPACATATAFFFAGCALAFFWLAPISIQFMYYFSAEMGLQVNWLASDYYNFIVILVLFVGVMFEFPLGIIAVQYLEIVSTKTLLAKWRWVIAIILLASVLVSPIGDPVALLGLTAILFLLYLAAVFAGDFLLRKKLLARASEEAAFDAEFSTKNKEPATPPSNTPHVAIVPAEINVPAATNVPVETSNEGDLRFIDE